MSERPASQPHVGNGQSARRDSLPTLELVTLREVEAAPIPRPSAYAWRATEFGDDDEDKHERDTAPGVDALLLRDAFLALGKKI